MPHVAACPPPGPRFAGGACRGRFRCARRCFRGDRLGQDHRSPFAGRADGPRRRDDPVRERRRRAASDALAVRARRIRLPQSRAGPVVFDEADGQGHVHVPRRARRRERALFRADRGWRWGRLGGGGSSDGGSPSASSASVSMAGRAFSPATVTIAAGGSVTFRNDDDRAHTVTADDGAFNSGPIGEGGSWKRTFKQAGTFSYLCAIHPEMTGKVVVKGSATPWPEPAPAPTPKPSPTPTPPDAGRHGDRRRSRDPGLLVRSAERQRSGGLDRHVAKRRRGTPHRDGRGRLVRLRDDRGRRVVGPHVRNRRDVPLRLRVPSPDGGRGRGHGRRGRRRVARAAVERTGAPSPRLRQQPPLPSEPAPETAAVSTQGPSFGGELMARFVIVGLLIGGAFLLFVRAVGGSVRSHGRDG